MNAKRSQVESELYQLTKHLHSIPDETLERVVAGEQIDRDRGPQIDVAFPPEETDELL